MSSPCLTSGWEFFGVDDFGSIFLACAEFDTAAHHWEGPPGKQRQGTEGRDGSATLSIPSQRHLNAWQTQIWAYWRSKRHCGDTLSNMMHFQTVWINFTKTFPYLGMLSNNSLTYTVKSNKPRQRPVWPRFILQCCTVYRIQNRS